MSLLSPQLQAFMAVVKQQTVHGAAGLLHLTQTGVTQRIRTLEASLNTTLFIRTRRGMMMTSEGEALWRYCLAAQDLEGETLAAIYGAAKQTLLRIVMSGPGSIMRSRIIPQCFSVMKKYENLLMHFDIRNTEDRDQLLRAGKTQFAIIQPENIAKEMQSKILANEKYVLVAPYAWKKRKLKNIIQNERFIDFNPEDQLTINYLKKYDLFDLAKHERHFVNHTESILSMVVSGFGYGVLTKEFSKTYIEKKQIVVLNQGKIFENAMALAWYPRPELPDYFSDLIQAIK